MKTVLHVVGARPNFMKVAPIHRAIAERGRLRQILVHTGQHYDVKMSDVFFTDLKLPPPDIHLGAGSGSHAEQTAKVMVELEKVCAGERPDLISVVGDVNSTLAASLVAAKALIPLAHVEAGLRSNDRTMPEEINRIVTDRLADFLLTPSTDADENLRREGVDEGRIFFVGNVMIDSLFTFRERAQRLPTLGQMGLAPRKYAVCTMHRPSNVDDPETLYDLLGALGEISRTVPVIFPVHPRTRKILSTADAPRKLADCPHRRKPPPWTCLASRYARTPNGRSPSPWAPTSSSALIRSASSPRRPKPSAETARKAACPTAGTVAPRRGSLKSSSIRCSALLPFPSLTSRD